MSSHICSNHNWKKGVDPITDDLVDEIVYCVEMNKKLAIGAFATMCDADVFVMMFTFDDAQVVLDNSRKPGMWSEAGKELAEAIFKKLTEKDTPPTPQELQDKG